MLNPDLKKALRITKRIVTIARTILEEIEKESKELRHAKLARRNAGRNRGKGNSK